MKKVYVQVEWNDGGFFHRISRLVVAEVQPEDPDSNHTWVWRVDLMGQLPLLLDLISHIHNGNGKFNDVLPQILAGNLDVLRTYVPEGTVGDFTPLVHDLMSMEKSLRDSTREEFEPTDAEFEAFFDEEDGD